MKKIYSKYRIFGGFGLQIALNGLIMFGLFKLLTDSQISFDKVDIIADPQALYTYAFLISINLFTLVLFAKDCRYIIIDTYGVTFINPLLPFIKRTYLWSDFSYYILVDEQSSYSTYEAVWLIQDDKVIKRFSSFTYTNYDELKRHIKTPLEMKMDLNLVEQILLILRLKKVKLPS